MLPSPWSIWRFYVCISCCLSFGNCYLGLLDQVGFSHCRVLKKTQNVVEVPGPRISSPSKSHRANIHTILTSACVSLEKVDITLRNIMKVSLSLPSSLKSSQIRAANGFTLISSTCANSSGPIFSDPLLQTACWVESRNGSTKIRWSF